jgi:UDP-N-acetylglucosamine 2-epimerase (non-hydrolysing)
MAGTIKLVGTDKVRIVAGVSLLLEDANQYQVISYSHNPYGDGSASKRIVEFLKENI